VNVDLYERRVTNGLEAVDLTSLNDKDISRAALEGLAVDGPHSPPFTDELNLVIRVPVRPRSRTRLPMLNSPGLLLDFSWVTGNSDVTRLGKVCRPSVQNEGRDYERSAPIGMMHMNRSHISELGVRKRGNYSISSAF
jgi:hypothetical protein